MDNINITIKNRILGIALALCLVTSAELKAQPSPPKVLSGEQAVKESAGKPWSEILAGAQQGDAALQYVAAWKLFHGEGIGFDPSAAIIWFRRAAERGVPEAQFKMGVLAEHGIGCRVDDAQAREWYTKALANGFIPAAHSLSRYESPEKWRELQIQSARAGYPLSRLTLIGMAEHAQLTAEQKAEAIAWGRELAGQGDHEAQIKLGFNLLQRGIDPVSLMEALKWIELARAAGVPGADMLAAGAGRSLNAQQLEEVQKGVRESAVTPKVSGNLWPHAARLLSHFNPLPESMSREVFAESVTSLRSAAGKGDRSAALKLAVALQHPSFVKDWQEIQRQQGPGMFVSPLEMGMAGAVNKALSEPALNYKLAAESGDGFACYALACQFFDGRGAPKSIPESVRWFDRGAKLGVTDCDFELGRLYLAGSGIDRSYSKALQHLRKASAASHEPAKAMLSRAFGGTAAGAQPAAISSGSTKSETGALPRVAILPLTAGLESEVSLLTVELSNSGEVILLEREELDRVRGEQMLAAGNRSKVLELAAMLRADGLILLEKTTESGTDQLSARMVAVSQGVVIGTIGQRVAPSNTQSWSALVGQRFLPLLPKLKTPRASSVALSVLAFRSTFNSAGSVENERNLTKLVSQRLISQPEVFVLERARLGAVAQEYRLEGWENREFWTGSVMVDGQLQPTGSSDELKLSLRLLLPSGELGGSVEITGNRGRLADLADRAGKEILTQLKRGGPSAPWDTLSESVRYLDEARWMMKWGQSDNAVAAIEVSEAMGLTLQELTEIRIQIKRSAGQAHAEIPSRQWQIAGSTGETNKRSLNTMREALELYSARTSNPSRGWEPDEAWHKLGLDVLTSAVNLLHGFYQTPVARLGRPQDLAALRVSCRKLLDQLVGVTSLKDGLDGLMIGPGACIYEKQSELAVFLSGRLDAGLGAGARTALKKRLQAAGGDALNWDGSQPSSQVNAEFRKVFEKYADSERLPIRLDNLVFMLWAGGTDAEKASDAAKLMTVAWNERNQIFKGPNPTGVLGDISETLGMTKSSQSSAAGETAPEFMQRLQKEYDAYKASLAPVRRATPAQPQVANVASAPAKPIVSIPPPAPVPVPVALPIPQAPNTSASASPNKGPMFAGATNVIVPHFWPSPGTVPDTASEDRSGRYLGWKYRDNHLWVHAAPPESYSGGGGGRMVPKQSPSSLFKIALPAMKTEIIPVDLWNMTKGGEPANPFFGDNFEVVGGRIFAMAKGVLRIRNANTGAWDTFSSGLPEDGVLHLINGRLFVTNPESIAEVDVKTGQIRLLASTRRKPAETIVDQMGTFQNLVLAPGAENRLWLWTGKQAFTCDLKQGNWEQNRSITFFGTTPPRIHIEGVQIGHATLGDVEGLWFMRTNRTEPENLSIKHGFQYDVFPISPKMKMGFGGFMGAGGMPAGMEPGLAPAFHGEDTYLVAFPRKQLVAMNGQPLGAGEPWKDEGVLWWYNSSNSIPFKTTVELRFPESKPSWTNHISRPYSQPSRSDLVPLGLPEGLLLTSGGINGMWFIPWKELAAMQRPETDVRALAEMARLAVLRDGKGESKADSGTGIEIPGSVLPAGILEYDRLLFRDRARRVIRSSDTNGDGRMDLQEYQALQMFRDDVFMQTGPMSWRMNADINGDGLIDVDELAAAMMGVPPPLRKPSPVAGGKQDADPRRN